MAMGPDQKWHVVSGDCMWRIAATVYGDGRRWQEIARVNGVSLTTALIYPGQVFVIPGITPGYGGSGSTTTPDTPTPSKQADINFMALVADSERTMGVGLVYSRDNFDNHYMVKAKYTTAESGESYIWLESDPDYPTEGSEVTSNYFTLEFPEVAQKIVIYVKPISTLKPGTQERYWTDGQWSEKSYDFRDNPPQLPPDPSFTINNQNLLELDFQNIQETFNGTGIEVAVYQDDTLKYLTGIIEINTETAYAHYSATVDPGHRYKIRCRGVRGDIYGGWTNFSSNEYSTPVSPEEITKLEVKAVTEQATTRYDLYIEWPASESATSYQVQYAYLIEDLPDNPVGSAQTTGNETHLTLTNVTTGHEYFVQVRSVNTKGGAITWSDIKSTTVGTKPAPPTTWSLSSSCILGQNMKLYWQNNSTDGSLEKTARIQFTITDTGGLSHVVVKTVNRDNSDPDKYLDPSVYIFNTTDPDFSDIEQGYTFKWKVQTCGASGEYSDFSTEREVNVYAEPTLTLGLQNAAGLPITEVNEYPFIITALAGPSAQRPISYYIEIVANEDYITSDDFGEKVAVHNGDIVYSKFLDPTISAWSFLLEMTPANVNLQNTINYTINCSCSMDSGLLAVESLTFDTNIPRNDFIDVSADVKVDKETLTATLHPYCKMYNRDEDEEIIITTPGTCYLSVYRREYDGSFTEIIKNVQNREDLFVTDPHPALDYARYRIVCKNTNNGEIYYNDIPIVKVGEPAIVIQWAETTSDYNVTSKEKVEPAWAGTMIKLPYNVDISDNRTPDVSFIEYAGREHPVAYYGTQLGDGASWTAVIPASDKDTLYALRRMSRWTGDFYVREPSGLGYWANVTVSYNIDHCAVTIPVSFSVKRVEGGM